MSRPRPRVAILYNPPTLAREHPDYASEAGVVDVALAVLGALKQRGFRPFLLTARTPAQRLVRSLERKKPDLVFNLIEAYDGNSRGEPHVTSLLELMKIPYTGSPPEAQALGRRKGLTKALLKGIGLPTAPFWVVEPGDPLPLDPWPGAVIVKPESEDASLGITQESIITRPEYLGSQVDKVRSQYGPRVLIETYLPGPEFNVGLLALPDPHVLPIAEIVYNMPHGEWPILTYSGKWDLGGDEDIGSRPRCPAHIDDALVQSLTKLAIGAFRACGLRDYARVDFRLDASGAPNILEVNPNPDLEPEVGLARAIRAAGRDWGETMAEIARQALARGVSND